MSIYNQFTADVERYLNSKIPELPQSTQMEIGEYISNRVSRLINDAWEEHTNKQARTRPKSRLRRWTGIKDKNGIEIREGDCLSHPHNVVELIGGEWIVAGDRPLGWVAKESVIIGNIHDNPGLLECDF